ncbi:peroxidase3 [Zea mays]|uniref:Peroxidase n=1 Tax=Zea mays TaxID=4577 RepID=A0A1D6IN00_MAIZE|nr:peroxidase3 [Zea mays]
MASSSVSSCLLLLLCLAAVASAQLSPTFYDSSCPNALSTIKSAVNAAVQKENRMGASLLRLHFHDCFVQASSAHSFIHSLASIASLCSLSGCDASVLLADNAATGFTGEQGAAPNAGSLRGFDVIANIKAQVEAVCKQTVSCADILAVAARDSVVALGGPSWTVPLGRRDSTTASLSLANSDLPPPFFNLGQLITAFGNKGFTATEMATLSGAHTIGQAQCKNFRDHIYNDTNINQGFASSLKANCPRPTGSGDGNLAPLDTTTPYSFDNAYYSNLLSQKGLLHSDQELFNGGSTDNTVRNFASNSAAFSSAFAAAMVKMGNLSPLTGSQGQIRLTCSTVN